MDETPHQWRPSWPRYLAFARPGLVVVAVIAAVGIVAVALSRSAASALLPLALVVGTGVVAFGAQALRLRRTTLSVDADWVTWRGVFGHRRLRRTELRGVLAPITQPMTASRTMLLVTDGQQRLRLVGGLWAETDLVDIATELQIQGSARPLRPTEVEQHTPGATTAVARHPWRTSVLAAVLILAVAVAAAVGLSASGRRGPARVSAATVLDQTRITHDIEAALVTTGWRQPQVKLQTCGGTGGSPQGWLRHVQVINEAGRANPTDAVPQVQTVLGTYGYGLLETRHFDAAVVMGGSRDTGFDSATVEVQIDPTYASIELIGACET